MPLRPVPLKLAPSARRASNAYGRMSASSPKRTLKPEFFETNGPNA